MDEYDKRKLGIFNLLNFFQLLTGIVVPAAGLINQAQLPASAWLVACLPALVSVLVLYLNHYGKHEVALLSYFILYPFFTCVVYINGMNLGVAPFFILYGVLSVFFLQNIGYMLFTIAWSMLSYFILAVVLKNYRYQLEAFNKPLYLFNQFLAIVFIYYGLLLIKKENNGYQHSILKKNRILHKKNLEIKRQKTEIAEKARLLTTQAAELQELNALKNKLFSVISHDLKTPMYALRNLFGNVQQYNMPADEIKEMVPEVVADLNYTISLMENLLQWSKSQMEAHAVRPDVIDMWQLVREVVQLVRLQAAVKQVQINFEPDEPVYAWADKDMISLVLRNLLSNAIKFTPPQGTVTISVNRCDAFAEVGVQDTGTGMSKEMMQQVRANNFYTAKGTTGEAGTGLGLMLCKEFLQKNNGHLHMESTYGKGSTFSFTLPQPE
jgi:signal transduction histidine kinase